MNTLFGALWNSVAFLSEVGLSLYKPDYVIDSVNGSDANDGSEELPWQSLSKIESTQFIDGDTVRYLIKTGTYDKVNDLIAWGHAFAGAYRVEIVCEVGCTFDGTAASVASSSFFDPQGPADVTVDFYGNGAVIRNFTNGTGNGLGGRGSLKYSAYDFEIYNCVDGLSTHEDCQAAYYRCYAHDCTKAPIAHIDNTVSKHFDCLISSSASSSGVILISSIPAEFTDCTLLVDGGDDRIALDNGVFERCQIGSTTENWRCSGASLGDKGTVTDSYVNVTGDISRAVDFTNCFGTLSYRQRNGGLGMTIDGCVLDGAIVNSNYNPGGGSVLNLTNNVFLASTVGAIDATNAGYLNAAGSVFSNNTLESGSWDADLLAALTITGTESGPTNVGSADSVDMADWLTPDASVGRGLKSTKSVGSSVTPPGLSFTFETAVKPFGAGAGLQINVPAGAQSGDLLLAVLGTDDTGGANNYTPTPTGWTLEYHGGTGTSDSTITVFSRVADGTEGASVDFGGGTSDDMGGALFCIPGGGAVTAGTGADILGTTITAPSVTTTAAGSLVFAVGTQDGGDTTGTTFSVSGGYTEETEILSGNGAGAGFGMVIGSNLQSAAGASPTVDLTSSRSDGMHAVQIAVAPAP